jgi:hypothetical protein
LQVESYLFKFDPIPLERDSAKFREHLQSFMSRNGDTLPNENNPLILEDTTANDFACFLEIIHPA